MSIERAISWEKPVTELPGEPTKIAGGLGFIKQNIGLVPKDGGWWRSPWPFNQKTNAAQQAKRKLQVFFPAYEFRVKERTFIFVRFRVEDACTGAPSCDAEVHDQDCLSQRED